LLQWARQPEPAGFRCLALALSGPIPHNPQALVVGGMVDTGLDKSSAKGVPKTVINIFSNASSFK
jgi:hypothetical protein